MAVYKELLSNDFQFREFIVNKQWTFTQDDNDEIKVYDAAGTQVGETETGNSLTGGTTDEVEITLSKSDFESHVYGQYTLEINCTGGSVTTNGTIDISYQE